MSGRCARTWQAEAIEDGRLEGAERASFERHAASCGECRSELAELQRLRAAAQKIPHREWTPLERRRLRLGLLAEANRRTTRNPPHWRGAVLVAALAVTAALVFFALGVPKLGDGPSAVAQGPVFEVTAEQGAKWTTEHRGAHTEARLVSGSLSIHVRKLEKAQRFVLKLPDGQLEVRGTRFSVEADQAHTLSVSVSEGVVVLTLPGAGKRVLHAGQHWARSGHETERASEELPTAPSTVSAETEPSATAPEGSAAPAASVASGSADREPGKAFSLAMEAFDAGNNGLAEQRLRAFLRKFPGDSRSEDATFLCAVARARQGDRAGAARWAQSYLVAYPNGLRRREAEAMVRAAPASSQ